MGPEDAGPVSRPPEVEDLVSLCRRLNESGARYAVIGGFAMILHGYARATMDIDLLVDPSPENIRKVKAALSALPDNAGAGIEDDDVLKHSVVRVADEIVVDLLGKACSVDIETALLHVLHREVSGVAVPTVDAATLIETKRTVRPKDQQDILFLKAKQSPP